jgi:hypothetical protein
MVRLRYSSAEWCRFLGQKDRSNCFNDVEERGGLRRQTIRSASRLSISGGSLLPSLAISEVVVGRIPETLGSRASISRSGGPRVLSAPSHHSHALAPRIIRNSDRSRVSNRTVITTQTALGLAKSSDSIGAVAAGRKTKRRKKNLQSKNFTEQNPFRANP